MAQFLINDFFASVSFLDCSKASNFSFQSFNFSIASHISLFSMILLLTSPIFFFSAMIFSSWPSFVFFSFRISFLAPSRSSAWMVMRLLSCFSLNSSICSLFMRSQLDLLRYLRTRLRWSISEFSVESSSPFSQSCLFTFFSCYCSFAFIFVDNPFPFLNSSRSLGLLCESSNFTKEVDFHACFSDSPIWPFSWLPYEYFCVNVKESSSFLSGGGNESNRTGRTADQEPLELLLILELSRSMDSNFHGFFIMLDINNKQTIKAKDLQTALKVSVSLFVED